MIKPIPEYNDVELQLAIDSSIEYPTSITELDFLHQIKSNKKIRWEVNPFVTDEPKIRILLDSANFNKWISIQRFGQIVGTCILYWCLRTWTYEMLLLLLIVPFTFVPLPHLLFILCMTIVIVTKLYFHLTIPLFWIIIPLIGISYGLIKSSTEFAERFIIKRAMSDWETFWRYYSKQIIYPAWNSDSGEIKNLLIRYPELILFEENKKDNCG